MTNAPTLTTGRGDDVAHEFEAIVDRALRRRPVERYSNATEMLDALSRLHDIVMHREKPIGTRSDRFASPASDARLGTANDSFRAFASHPVRIFRRTRRCRRWGWAWLQRSGKHPRSAARRKPVAKSLKSRPRHAQTFAPALRASFSLSRRRSQCSRGVLQRGFALQPEGRPSRISGDLSPS